MTVSIDEFHFDRVMDSIFNVSNENRITVNAGDIFGLRAQFDRDCDDMRLWIAGTRYTDNTVYHNRIEEEEDSSRSRDRDINNICRYERDGMSPYITAVVGKKDMFKYDYLQNNYFYMQL